MSSIDIPELELEFWCVRCSGNGYKAWAEGVKPVCTTCNGLGYIATSDGEKLIAFLERRGIEMKR